MNAPFSTAEDQKRAAGEAAALLVEDGMTVGLGTGSTAVYFVRALGARGLDLRGVPTSEATARLAESVGIRLTTLDEAGELDLTVDGADEIDPDLNCIKGAGGALLREKLVWEASRRRVVIADIAKPVQLLGAFALPVEVVAFGYATTARRMRGVLSDCGLPQVTPTLRRVDEVPVLTDGGNVVFDLRCGRIDDLDGLAISLKHLTGVVEHGLFVGLAQELIVGGPEGVETISRPLSSPPGVRR